RDLPDPFGVRDTRSDALDGVGRVHHLGDDRRARDPRGPDPRRRVLHDPPRQGVLVRGLVLHRHRRRPGADRAVHARGAPRRPAVGRLPAMAARGVVLEVDSVSKSFGALAALSRVGFAVSEGQVFSVIGPNGAGPTLRRLDEPTAGMTPGETKEATALIGRIALQRGLTVLLIEHDMSVVMGISDRVAVLHFGEKSAEGTPEAIRSDPRVIEAYLGGAED